MFVSSRIIPFEITSNADVAELVDALDLGSSIERCGSSSLPIRTILDKVFLYSDTIKRVVTSLARETL